MQIQISSFFDQTWKDSDLEQFKKSVQPVSDDELNEFLEAMKRGEHILSTVGTLKFRIKPDKLEDTKYKAAIAKAHNQRLPVIDTKNRAELYALLDQHGFYWNEQAGAWAGSEDKQ